MNAKLKRKMQEKLFYLCKDAMKNAYVPYSNFPVGAAAILKDNKAFIGANIENAAYGSGMCAERSCINAIYSQGYRQEDIMGFAIMSDTQAPSSPCGACRQVLLELLEPDTPICLFNVEGELVETTIRELVPYPFDEEALNNV